jgi:hypothetical protein
MIKWYCDRAIDNVERDWNYDASYMRDMIDASPRAAWLFSRVTALGQFRRDLPIEAWCVACNTAVRHDAAADAYREAIVKCWGRRALVSLAFAITAARIYPTVKYALGHGKACMRVVVGGTPAMFDHRRVPAPADVAVRTA